MPLWRCDMVRVLLRWMCWCGDASEAQLEEAFSRYLETAATLSLPWEVRRMCRFQAATAARELRLRRLISRAVAGARRVG